METNRKTYKLVIFDVDGTLLDTLEGLLKSSEYTIRWLGYDMPSQEILLSFVGPRIQDSFRSFTDCRKEDAVMAGDSSYDAIAAREAGVDFIGVTYGFEFCSAEDADRWDNVGTVAKAAELIKSLCFPD